DQPKDPVDPPVDNPSLQTPQDGIAPNTQTLTAKEVQDVIQAVVDSVNSDKLVVAVTDRQGVQLGVYRKGGGPQYAIGNLGRPEDVDELAVALARTTSFFSHSQAPLTTRTVRFISGIHFPPAVPFVPTADLYGIENTNRGCSFNVDIPNLPRATS